MAMKGLPKNAGNSNLQNSLGTMDAIHDPGTALEFLPFGSISSEHLSYISR